MIHSIYTYLFLLILSQLIFAEIAVKIINTKGEAKVRYGVDEKWKTATQGITLKEIDTILTGEGGEIILQLDGGKKFILGSNSILDIGDLREIQEKELFLFLMSKKVEKFEPRKGKTQLRIGNVSSVYGEDKTIFDNSNEFFTSEDLATKQFNGALALFIQEYYTNTLYKLHNIIEKYASNIEIGRIQFYIAKAFEALGKEGQSLDSYKKVVETYGNKESLSPIEKEYLEESKNAINRLKKDE